MLLHRCAAQHTIGQLPLRHSHQLGGQLGPIRGDDGQTLVKGTPPHRRSVTEITQIHRPLRLQMSVIARRQLGQRRPILRRQSQQMHRPRQSCCLLISCLVSRLSCLSRRRSHHQMRIRPAQAKGANTRHPFTHCCALVFSHCRPGLQGGRHCNRHLIPLDVGIGGGEMEMGGNLPMLQGQHRLDKTGNARGLFQMGHIGLHRTDQQGGFPFVTKDSPQCPNLNRITERGAGAVRFDIANRGRCHSGCGESLAQQLLLGALVGHG